MDGPSNSTGLRDIAISRRGGVKTRGGRLPPIRMRDIVQVTGTKKVVVPNIPQRRAVVKKEVEQTQTGQFLVKTEPKDDFRRQKKNQKVLLQTEGTFLADGPAARVKRDRDALDVSYSLPRVSSKAKASDFAMKYDFESMKDVLNSYEANQSYDDDFRGKPPYRLPLVKKEMMAKIKSEPEDDDDFVKVKIKQEVTDDDSQEIKTEPEDIKSPLKFFQDVKRDGTMILLKLPSPSPFERQKDETTSKDAVQESELEEGCIGKLRFMRSGRMKMIFGSVELELLDAMPSESYMEAAAIKAGEDRADLVILGKVDRTMVLSPIVNGLLEPSKESQSIYSD